MDTITAKRGARLGRFPIKQIGAKRNRRSSYAVRVISAAIRPRSANSGRAVFRTPPLCGASSRLNIRRVSFLGGRPGLHPP